MFVTNVNIRLVIALTSPLTYSLIHWWRLQAGLMTGSAPRLIFSQSEHTEFHGTYCRFNPYQKNIIGKSYILKSMKSVINFDINIDKISPNASQETLYWNFCKDRQHADLLSYGKYVIKVLPICIIWNKCPNKLIYEAILHPHYIKCRMY